MPEPSIAALVLTYNEENILEQCLQALDFVDTTVVFDSFSTDATLEIAQKHGAKTLQRTFDNYARQRNHALAAIPHHIDWVLMVDADELVTPELRAEILTKIRNPGDTTLYRVRRKDIFQNRWIKQSSGYPTWFPRLFKNGCVTVKRAINEEYETGGHVSELQGHLMHYPFNKGLTWWFEKHNRYSQMEAELMCLELREPLSLASLFSKDPVERRKAQKRLSYRLPFRPFLIFCALYFYRGGFLNGRAGFTFCRLRQSYEWMIALKLKELKARACESPEAQRTSKSLKAKKTPANLP